jgi:DNA-binding MarR family transcriptional regulator
MDKERRMGKEVIIFANRITRTIDKESSKYGVTGVQGRILGFIYHESSKRDIFQRDIEEDLDIRRSSVTSVLQLMEKNELIKRVSVCQDGRLKKLILTQKGLETHQNVRSCIDKLEESFKSHLSIDEFNILISLIDRLSKKIAD